VFLDKETGDATEAVALMEQIRIHPLAEKDYPPEMRFPNGSGKPANRVFPRDYSYFAGLAECVNAEAEVRGAAHDMWQIAVARMTEPGKYLFVGPGREVPDNAEAQGYTVAKSPSMNLLVGIPDRRGAGRRGHGQGQRFLQAPRGSARHGRFEVGIHHRLAARSAARILRRAGRTRSLVYEAVTNDPAMHGQKTGKGQVYLAAYKDEDGDWLDGGRSCKLQARADAPAETFWSVTAYEVSIRTLINNKYEVADRSSRMELAMNPDGSVDIYVGPDKPEGDKARTGSRPRPIVPGFRTSGSIRLTIMPPCGALGR
jgi:hypothetical protein